MNIRKLIPIGAVLTLAAFLGTAGAASATKYRIAGTSKPLFTTAEDCLAASGTPPGCVIIYENVVSSKHHMPPPPSGQARMTTIPASSVKGGGHTPVEIWACLSSGNHIGSVPESGICPQGSVIIWIE